MKLVWSKTASADRKAIREYIARQPTAALALDQQIAEKARHLLDHPKLGRAGPVAQAAARRCSQRMKPPNTGSLA